MPFQKFSHDFIFVAHFRLDICVHLASVVSFVVFILDHLFRLALAFYQEYEHEESGLKFTVKIPRS